MDEAAPQNMFDLAATRLKFLSWIREIYEREGKLNPSMAQIWHTDGSLGCVAFDGSVDNRAQREKLRELVSAAIARGGPRPVVVLHAMEVWSLDLPPGEKPVADFSKDPRSVEKVVIYEETEGGKIRRHEAPIIRADSQPPKLADWTEIPPERLTLPRPGFKRYFPEQHLATAPAVA